MSAGKPVVYRLYDATGRLIYIGCSHHLAGRLKTHRSQSWWYRLVDRVEIEPHATPQAARAAEAEAIRLERPAFNLTTYSGTRLHRFPLSDADVRVCREWAMSDERVGLLPVSLRWVTCTAA